MVKIFLVVTLLLSGCTVKNQFGNYRIKSKRFTIIPNSNIDKITPIDTSCIYRFVDEVRFNVSGVTQEACYKFFSNGKVGSYGLYVKNLEENNAFESNKGRMGYYKIEGNKIIAQFYYYNWNFGKRFPIDTLMVNKDTLKVTHNMSDKYTKAYIKQTYIKQKLNKNVRITTPDW